MDMEAYGNGGRPLLTVPQCETCENYLKGDLLHCRCYDWEIKLRESGERTEFGMTAASEAQMTGVSAAEPGEMTAAVSTAEPGEKAMAVGAAEPGEKAMAVGTAEPGQMAAAEKAAGKRKRAALYLGAGGCALGAVLIGCSAYGYWYYRQPRFHDLTVELGTETISVEAFMTEFANARNSGIVTDLSTVDISVAGEIPLTLRSGRKTETITLTIEDTTPPEVEFISWLQKTPDYIPDPCDFVASCHDLSDVTVSFAEHVVIPKNYEDQSFTVVVEDAYGNAVSQRCTLSIIWMKSECTLELGELLDKEDVLFQPVRDGYRIEQRDIDVINASGTGEYTLSSFMDESICRVHVVDTTPPELSVKDISIFKGEKVTADSFVASCFDSSGDVEIRLLTEPDVNTLGKQPITIEATDSSGNTATATATMAVVRDKKPPVIKGLTTLNVAKNSTPDYLAGVRAIDAADGVCEVTFDAGRVDLTAAGTYYVTYTSRDTDGNVATSRRTVVVGHDQADTDALADSIAAGLGSDPEAIRDYVRNTIKYSHNAGGNDPVWYGFTNKSGNCLVHALCLQSLLSRKGYETQLIWVTDQSHYWLIINLDGVWRHIDATPGRLHTKYSLMTDEQRYSILQGRDWDRSAWPACE